MKKKLSDRITEGIILVALILLALACLYPFVYFLACSFNTASDTMRGGFMIWPREFTLDNYKTAFENKNIFQSFKVSIFSTVMDAAVNTLLTGMAAYALTFKDMPFRKWLTIFMFIPTILSGGVVPNYILYRQLHLTTSLWIYVLPGLYSFFNIVIMRTFFEGIPAGLSEAAYIDGCSQAGIFFKIILPLSTPIIATMLLFNGVAQWNDWYTGAFFVTRDELRPASTLLQQILNEADVMSSIENLEEQGVYLDESEISRTVTPESLRMTFVMIITLPIVCVYPFLQKYFVKGVLVGSIK